MSTGSIVALVLLVGSAVLLAIGIHVAAKFMSRRRLKRRVERFLNSCDVVSISATRMGPKP